uniref:Uncharacterized protein n=1 Tax=Anguilla anguilla TaxID=7936 RepID=A0A0E9S704_ANGAN
MVLGTVCKKNRCKSSAIPVDSSSALGKTSHSTHFSPHIMHLLEDTKCKISA